MILVGTVEGTWDSTTQGGYDFAAVKLDADGTTLWRWQVCSDYLLPIEYLCSQCQHLIIDESPHAELTCNHYIIDCHSGVVESTEVVLALTDSQDHPRPRARKGARYFEVVSQLVHGALPNAQAFRIITSATITDEQTNDEIVHCPRVEMRSMILTFGYSE